MLLRRFSFGAGAAWLLLLVALVALPGCGDNEGDIVAPAISPNVGNSYFTTSSSVTLKVDVEAGADIEVAVADGVTAGVPAVVGTSELGETWSFEVSGLQPGSNAIAVTAKDKTGNQQTLFMTVVYDFVSIDKFITPIDSAVTGLLDIGGTVADSIDLLSELTLVVKSDTLVLDTSSLDISTANHWTATLDLSAASDGTYTMTIEATDENGVHYSTSSAFIVQTGVPQVAITTLPPPDLVGTRTSDAGVTVKLNGAVLSVDTTSVLTGWRVDGVTLRPGKNSIEVNVTDGAGLSATAYDAVWN